MALTDNQTGATIASHGAEFKGTLAGIVSKGDIVGYSSGWVRALATVSSVVQGLAVALEDGVSGDVISLSDAAVVEGRYAGGTPGAQLFVAEGSSNGKVTETKPSTTNDATTCCGFMLTATDAYLRPCSATFSLSA